MMSIEKKVCTKCLVEKDTLEFYRKGNRIDSWCKECKKKKRRAKYLVGLNELNKQDFNRLKLFVKLMTSRQAQGLESINKELRNIISKSLKTSSEDFLDTG